MRRIRDLVLREFDVPEIENKGSDKHIELGESEFADDDWYKKLKQLELRANTLLSGMFLEMNARAQELLSLSSVET